MSKRKFFKQVLTVTILSEDVPLEWDDLGDVAKAIDDGPCVGTIEDNGPVPLSAFAMARALEAAGSEPSFFMISEDDENNDPDLDAMIDEVVDKMEDWDLDTLLTWAKNVRVDMLNNADPDTIKNEWYEAIG